VQIGAADICRYGLDVAVDRLSRRIAEGLKVYLLNFDAIPFDDATVGIRNHLQTRLSHRVQLSCRVRNALPEMHIEHKDR
jgi:hypothetical protein